MVDWRFAEALEVHTRRVVAKWWEDRRPSAVAAIPVGLVQDLQAARLALEASLERRLRGVVYILEEPQRAGFIEKIAELDPWHVLSEMTTGRTQPDPAAAKRQAADDDGDLIAALEERARRRERLERPMFPNKARPRLRKLAHGRGGLGAVLKDDNACRMLRFGAARCDLIDINLGVREEPDPDEVRAELATLSGADARRAAEAVLGDPLVGSDERGRPGDLEILRFVRIVIVVVWRRQHPRYRFKSTITRRSARSPSLGDRPNSDIQLILDLLACHAPSKTAEAVADLIKNARSPKRRR